MAKRTAKELWDVLDEATLDAEIESALAMTPEERRQALIEDGTRHRRAARRRRRVLCLVTGEGRGGNIARCVPDCGSQGAIGIGARPASRSSGPHPSQEGVDPVARRGCGHRRRRRWDRDQRRAHAGSGRKPSSSQGSCGLAPRCSADRFRRKEMGDVPRASR